MGEELKIDAAVNTIKSAFAPLRCVAEPTDYNHRLRFRVFDAQNNPILTADDLLMSQVCDLNSLTILINEARERIERKGFKLQAWKPFPAN